MEIDPKQLKLRNQIVELLSYGFKAKDISKKIGISHRTVEGHIRNILLEGYDNTTHLVATYLRKGIIK